MTGKLPVFKVLLELVKRCHIFYHPILYYRLELRTVPNIYTVYIIIRLPQSVPRCLGRGCGLDAGREGGGGGVVTKEVRGEAGRRP